MKRACTLILAMAVLGVSIAPRAAATELTWSPDLQAVAPGAPGFLSVITADTVRLRTIDVIIEADPELLVDMTASPGAAFAGLPCMVWQESEILEPGRWHGFAVIIGAACETAGPGELLRWDFTAGPVGSTLVRSVEAKLYAPDGSLLENVSLDHATILISDVSDLPTPVPGPALRLAPNPFNPRVTVWVDTPDAARGTVTVHDLRGRTIALLRDGHLPAGGCELQWNGRSDAGGAQPSGTYFFVLRSGGRVCSTARGLLLR